MVHCRAQWMEDRNISCTISCLRSSKSISHLFFSSSYLSSYFFFRPSISTACSDFMSSNNRHNLSYLNAHTFSFLWHRSLGLTQPAFVLISLCSPSNYYCTLCGIPSNSLLSDCSNSNWLSACEWSHLAVHTVTSTPHTLAGGSVPLSGRNSQCKWTQAIQMVDFEPHDQMSKQLISLELPEKAIWSGQHLPPDSGRSGGILLFCFESFCFSLELLVLVQGEACRMPCSIMARVL